jgi:hypothetical protein
MDWEIESGAMAAVYSNAFLVVGASRARDSSQGFIRSTRCIEPKIPVATVENDNGTTSKIYARRWVTHGDLCRPLSWRKDSSPLALRGWTLQEQILSTRMVHFERNELFWECRTSIRCECMELNDVRHYKEAMEIEATKQSFRIWHSIVDQYHLRSLTHESDFLPALSGIVTRLQEYGAGEYLAGLWKIDLHRKLMWNYDRKSRPYMRSQSYRAPTWSWASLRPYMTDHYRILYFPFSDQEFTPLSRILHASCSPSGHDRNGAVRSGEIIMEAKLVAMQFSEHKPDGGFYMSSFSMELGLTRDWLLPKAITWVPMCPTFDAGRSEFELARLRGILLLSVHAMTQSPESPRPEWLAGIILHELSGRENVFERVGIWTTIPIGDHTCSESCE